MKYLIIILLALTTYLQGQHINRNMPSDVGDQNTITIWDSTNNKYKNVTLTELLELYDNIVPEKNENDTISGQWVFEKTIILNKVIQNTKDHCFYAFEDSAVAIEVPIEEAWYQITNSENNLFTAIQDLTGFSLSGDTITYTSTDSISGSGVHILFHWGVDGYSTTGNDFEFRIYNITKTQSVVRKAEVTATGTTNRVSVGTTSYCMNVDVGDKFIIQLRNLSGSTAFTVENASIYAEVSHY